MKTFSILICCILLQLNSIYQNLNMPSGNGVTNVIYTVGGNFNSQLFYLI